MFIIKPEMTEISRCLYDAARSDILTIQDAVEYLEKNSKIRTLREKLEKFSRGKNLRKILVQGLMEHDPKRKKDAVERRVRGWLSTKNPVSSIKKQDAIEVCFILELSIEEADELITMISEESLHYRNPDEIVYIFALQHDMSYTEAAELHTQMKSLLSRAKDRMTPSEDSFTPIIREEITALDTKEELADYLEHAAERLGRYHNNAYEIFRDMMDILKEPALEENLAAAEVTGQERLSVRSILKEYMYERNVLYAKELAGKKKKGELSGEERLLFTKVQENVAANWPDETTLSRMKSRKTDVTRKVLILLFLAVDQGADEEDELQNGRYMDGGGYGDDGRYLDRDEDGDIDTLREAAFESLYSRLNYMLVLCGFAPLDPRSPFDWLVIYGICEEDMWGVDIRMRGLFRKMFGERPDEEKDNGN